MRRLTLTTGIALAVASCGGGSEGGRNPTGPPPPSGTGTIVLSVSTTGTDLDPDGYQAAIRFQASDVLEVQDEVNWKVDAGSYTIQLDDVAKNCAVQGENPPSVSVSSGQTTRLTIDIVCTELPTLKGRIVFSGTAGTGNTNDVFVMNADGSVVEQLTFTTDAWERAPEVSPDGKRIVFYRDLDEGDRIFTIQSDGGEDNAIGSGARPAWSADGRRIVFHREDPSSGRAWLWTVDAGGGTPVQLTNDNTWDDFPSYSADGSKIAFFRSPPNDIYSMNADGTGIQRLTEDAVATFQPRWSPDGTKVLYVTTRDGNNEIYVANADGTGETNLTNHAGTDDYGTWSPDGSQIAFTSSRDTNNPFNLDVFVMNADGSNPVNLTAASRPAGSPESLYWVR